MLLTFLRSADPAQRVSTRHHHHRTAQSPLKAQRQLTAENTFNYETNTV